MATRLVHLSDIHLPARDPAQQSALIEAVQAQNADLILISGDITRRGARSEFRAGVAFAEALPGRKMVLPGNHDIPVRNLAQRALDPFGRFYRSFALSTETVFESADLLLVGMNTAVGMRAALDWSLGFAAPKSIAATQAILRERAAGRLALVACHHPLLPNDLDPARSRTEGGEAAFAALAASGMDILLHGHLHRSLMRRHDIDGRPVYDICANTALSDRERAGSSGFNVLNVEGRTWSLTNFVWQDPHYRAA